MAILLKFLRDHTNFDLYPINPKFQGENLVGLKVYSYLADLPVKVDLIVAVVPPIVTKQVFFEAIELGISNFWCQPGAGDLQLKDLARGKIRLILDKCIMIALNERNIYSN